MDWTLAVVIIAELGGDMSVFQSVSQLASWAGVCPGINESAGKRKSSRIPKGNVYLKTALVEAVHSAAKTDAGCGFGVVTFALLDALRKKNFDYRGVDAFDLTRAMLVRFQQTLDARARGA